MDIECFNDALASEQYVDQNGRTVLWRRFKRDDWAIDRFGGKPWSEKFPDNERLTINGESANCRFSADICRNVPGPVYGHGWNADVRVLNF